MKAVGYLRVYVRKKDARCDVEPDRWTYSDLAIAPPLDDEFDALDLYHATAGGEEALARKRREDVIRARISPGRQVSLAPRWLVAHHRRRSASDDPFWS